MADYRISSSASNAIGKLIAKESSYIGAAAMKAVSAGSRGSMNLVRVLASGLEQQMSDGSDLRKVHEEVAANMRQAVKSSFEQTVKSRPGQYRGGQNRISDGVLKRAITDPSMAVGTEEGIDFVNERKLDTEARHWKRLNFGALGTAQSGRTAKSYPLRFDGVTLFRVGFSDQSRPAFSLPPGAFSSPEGVFQPHDSTRTGMDRFYPGGVGTRLRIPTRGIKPREFLDAGLRRMVEDLPVAYMTMIEGWLDDAEKSVKLPPVVNVQAGFGRDSLGRFMQANP
jgi:hypothetical protein